jgi:SAM-dependent MidA family methyltransferase
LPEAATLGDSLAERMARLIETDGPVPVSTYMARANAYYYATRDPLGAAGDFVTAPEISQMFGELIGVWLTDLWTRSGKPAGARYVELGPGRGTLAVDALRAMRAAGLEPAVELVETSPVLREAQASRLPQARWHDHPDELPGEGPIMIVANEFFDALPVRQFVASGQGWHERLVDHRDGRFVPIAGSPVAGLTIPDSLRALESGSIVESSPVSAAIFGALAARIAHRGGAMLVIDYGHARSAAGDTLQAVRAHRFADPWEAPGERDLTAHVDFEALGDAARHEGVTLFGPIGQGSWLRALGIEARAAALSRAAPDRSHEIAEALERLTAAARMGELFKVMALVASGWAEPVGF